MVPLCAQVEDDTCLREEARPRYRGCCQIDKSPLTHVEHVASWNATKDFKMFQE